MIERSYFYHGVVDCDGGGTKRFSGAVTLRSWIPDSHAVYMDIHKIQAKHYKEDTAGKNIHILGFNRA